MSSVGHPHHKQIVIVTSVAVSLALVAAAIVVTGYFTNWFQNGAAPTSDPQTTDTGFPDTVTLALTNTATNYTQSYTMTRTTDLQTIVDVPPRTPDDADVSIMKKIKSGDVVAFWQKLDSDSNFSNGLFVAANNGYFDTDDAYVWGFINATTVMTSYTTSNTTNVRSLSNNTWVSTSENMAVNITV